MSQYDAAVAQLFADLQISSGRATLYAGYLARWLADKAEALGRAPTAVDFGCGNGLYSCALAQAGAAVVCGFDPSEDMIGHGIARAAELALSGRVRLTSSIGDLPASADCIITVHTTYHFGSQAALVDEFFEPIRAMLSGKASELLLIVANPDEPACTPAYYWNAVRREVADAVGGRNVPADPESNLVRLDHLADAASKNGRTFILPDKTEMVATFVAKGRQRAINDTYHSLDGLLAAASDAGLAMSAKPVPLHNMAFPQPHAAYLALHFRGR